MAFPQNVTIMGKNIPIIPILTLAVLIFGVAFIAQNSIFGNAELQIHVTNQETNENVVGITLTIGDQNIVTDENGRVYLSLGLGQSKRVIIQDAEFENYQQNVTVFQNPTFVQIKLKPKEQAPTFTVTFVQSDGKKIPGGHEVAVQWRCTKSGEEKSEVVKNARMLITKPLDCGRLYLKASSTGYVTQSGVEVAQDFTIRFLENYTPRGKLVVNVVDGKTKKAPAASFMVLVYDEKEALIEQKILNKNQAKFENLPVGAYLVQAVDENHYAMSDLIAVDINQNRTTPVVIKVSPEPESVLLVQVKDETGKTISNARVAAREKESGQLLGEALTNAAGSTTLAFEKATPIELVTIANGYAWSRQSINLTPGKSPVTATLETCQLVKKNCGVIRVVVMDDEGQKVANARITLFNAATNTLAVAQSHFTDQNGTTVFDNVPAGMYYVRASKDEQAFTQGENFSFDPTGEQEEIITLDVGRLAVLIDVTNADLESLSGAQINLVMEGQSDCRPLLASCHFTTDESGSFQFELRKDQSFYFTITKEGYLFYESPLYEAYLKNDSLRVSVALKEPADISGEAPQITFLAMADEVGHTSRKMVRAKKYYAYFEIIFPQTGKKEVLIRAGDAQDVFNDDIQIKSVQAQSGFFIGGQTYQPPKNEAEDRAETVLAGEGYKWAQITWEDTQAGIVHARVELQINENTLPNTELELYYRAQNSVTERGIVHRDPVDEVLKEKETDQQRDALYATSHLELFYEGTAGGGENGLGFCSESWCLKEREVKVNGEEAGETENESYLVQTGGNNQIKWTLVNNTAQTMHDINLVIQNALGENSENNYYITRVAFETAEKNIEQSNIGFGNGQGFIPFLESGKELTAIVEFIALDALDAPISWQALNGEGAFFQDTVFIETDSKNRLIVETDNSEIPLLKSSNVLVQVLNDKQASVGEALTSVVINGQVQQQLLTSETGEVQLVIPPVSSSASVKIRAEKRAFIPGEKSFTISHGIFRIEPDPILIELDQVGVREQTSSLRITNESGQTFLVTGFEKTGNNRGILDEERINQALIGHVGTTLMTPGENQSFDILFALDADVRIKTSQKTNGTLILDLLDQEFKNHYRLVIPYQVQVSLGQALQDDKCLKVSPKGWRSTTVEGFAKTNFTVTNTCQAGSTPATIQTFEARVKWKSEITGNIIADVTTKNGSRREILKNEYTTLSAKLEPNETAKVELSFVPLNGKLGKKAIFDVGFNGRVAREGSIVEIGPDADVNSFIFIANLEQCVTFSPKPNPGLVMDGEKDDATFEISTENCGPIPIDFRFCSEENNAKCAGGTEGGIELSQWDINQLKESKEKITVSRWPDSKTQIAGQYGVTLQVKTPESNWKPVGEYAVTIQPNTNPDEVTGAQPYYFSLNRYQVFLPDANGRDSLDLTNTQFTEAVEVTACHTAWAEASSNPAFTGSAISAGTGTILMAGAAVWQAIGQTTVATTTTVLPTSSLSTAIGEAPALYPDTFISVDPATGTAEYSTLSTKDPSALGISPTDVANLGAGMAVGAVATLAGNWISASLGGGAIGGIVGGVAAAGIYFALGAAVNAVFPALLGFCAIPPGIGCVIGAVLAGVMVLVTSLMNTAPDCIPITSTLSDYVINLAGAGDPSAAQYLPSDARDIFIDKNGTKVAWQLGITDYGTPPGEIGPKQEVGILFFRDGKETMNNPTYTTLTVQALEHIHGNDVNHQPGRASVDCEKEGNFGVLWIPCEETQVIRTEKFHIRMKTNESMDRYIQPETNTQACISGSRYGTTGPQAVPKIKLDWSWNESSGIAWDTCDAANPNAVYCDATQFTIMVSKRLQEMENVLRKNDYLDGICPRDQAIQSERAGFTFGYGADGNITLATISDANGNITQNPFIIPAGKVAFTSLYRSSITQPFTFQTSVTNNSYTNAALSAQVVVLDSQLRVEDTCVFEPIILGPQGNATPTCTLSKKLEPKFYLARLEVTTQPENQAVLLDTNITTSFNVIKQNPLYENGVVNCDIPRTTQILLGEPLLQRFLEKKTNFEGTIVAPTKAKTLSLTHFYAYLQKDAFTTDFRKDFFKAYHDSGIDVPVWFTGPDGLGQSLDDGRMMFTQRYYLDEKVYHPGLYRIDIEVLYGNTWELYPDNNQERPFITVSFYPLEEPTDGSLLYYQPINGLVGMEQERISRRGYGTEYDTNQRFKFQQAITSAVALPKDGNSQALQHVQIQYENDFGRLNAQAEKQGNLFSITRNESGGYKWVSSPTLATPIIMRVNEPEKKSNAKAYYQLLQDQQAYAPNEVLALWTASGQCLDFGGQSAIQVFDQTPDRKITSRDSFPQTPAGYATDWPVVEETGSEWIKTIIYSPIGHQYSIQSISPNASFYAPENKVEGRSLTLGGIIGMNHNYQGLTTDQTPQTLESIFKLVASGDVCVTRTENSEEYWWNPESLYQKKGRGESVREFEEKLVAGETCVG